MNILDIFKGQVSLWAFLVWLLQQLMAAAQ